MKCNKHCFPVLFAVAENGTTVETRNIKKPYVWDKRKHIPERNVFSSLPFVWYNRKSKTIFEHKILYRNKTLFTLSEFLQCERCVNYNILCAYNQALNVQFYDIF